jgi:hypothetical protein
MQDEADQFGQPLVGPDDADALPSSIACERSFHPTRSGHSAAHLGQRHGGATHLSTAVDGTCE